MTTIRIPRMKIKKPSKRTLLIFSFVLTVVIAFIISASYVYAESVDQMIPSDKTTNTLYNKYDASHYSFQTITPDRRFWQIGAKANDSAARMYDQALSGVFLGGVYITRFFNFLTREAFTFSFMNDLIDAAAGMIQSLTGITNGTLGSGLWSSVFGMFASITVLYILWQIIRFRFLDSLQTIISFIIALVVAFAFFTQAGTFLKFLNNTGYELGAAMYAGLAKPGGLSTSTETGVTQISDQVWMELVIKPYGMLQFNDGTAYEKHPSQVDQVLKTKPFSDARETALKNIQSTFPAVADVRPHEQMIILLFAALFGIVIIGFLSFWACVTIYMRLKLLIHAIVMSVTLLASLIPGREASIAVTRGQFLKLIGLVISTVFTMFFLDLSLVAGHVVYNVVAIKAKAGWFTGMALEAVIIFVIFKYREEIGSVFSKAAGHIPMPQKAKSTVIDAIQRNVTRSLYNKGMSTISDMFNKKETEGVPGSFNPSALSKAGESMNDATTASMQLRYQREKDASEQLAAETGGPVQYTPFVAQVNENMRNGTKNPFRGMDKEWKDEKNRLSAIHKDGGDLRQAILSHGVTDDMNDQQVAATMYANENSIRNASMFMVNRPKAAVRQLQRAGTLNKNRMLETSVNDFVMVELFQRYKAEHKAAIDNAAVTGEPVNHSEFVKSMDKRFKSEGLHNTNQINDRMTTRGGRITHAGSFSSMPEFKQKKEELLRANEAFRKATGTIEGVPIPEKSVGNPVPMNAFGMLNNVSGVKVLPPKTPPAPTVQEPLTDSFVPKNFVPMSHQAILKSAKSATLASGGGTQVISQDIDLLVKPKINSSVDLSNVKIPDDMTKAIKASNDKIKYNNARADLAERVVIKTSSDIDLQHTSRINMTVDNKMDGNTKVDMSQVKLPKDLKKSMEAAKKKLQKDAKMNIGDRLEMDIERNIEVFTTLKQRVSQQVSNDLSNLDHELKIMQKANGNRLAEAPTNASTSSLVKKNARTAQETRKKNQRPTI
ncbi:CD3337/EF1877 family mobilome membrane protein [Cohnella soli]|uniref:CD3337/EF1877 family mobilome membrane protein n=1 Tax=Cohnella soli TaxID=425005 RepID=A0ABW0HPM4_9BACL